MVLLTNGRIWKLYHVEFGQPPITKMVEQWDLLEDDVPELAEKFKSISYKSIKKGSLKKLWEKTSVLLPNNLLTAITSPDSIKVLRRVLKKNSGVIIEPVELINGIQKLLNEAAAIELSRIKINFPEKKKKVKENNQNTQQGIHNETDALSSANEEVDKKPDMKIKCSSCGSSLIAPAKLAGKQSKCPKCSQVVMVQ